MISKRSSVHGQWSSRWVFILAATGSAVGLGNIWRFPYLVGENGGGAFVLVYLICVVLVGVPIMMAEILLGRRGRQSPINTMSILAAEERLSHYWQLIGWMGVIAGFIILSYYSVIAGWTLAYIFRTGAGAFIGADGDFSKNMFTELVSDPEKLLAWHTIFIMMSRARCAQRSRVAARRPRALWQRMRGVLRAVLVMRELRCAECAVLQRGLEATLRPHESQALSNRCFML